VRKRTLKKILLSLIVIGGLGSITTGGTYAVFQSDTTNGSSAIASGTLTMSNNVGATTCNSKDGTGNSVSTGCATLFTTATLQYPGAVAKANITLTNTGSVPGYALSVSMPGATAGAGCTESPSGTSGAVIGGGHPCGSTGDFFYIQETASDFTTAIHCWYPSGAGSTCPTTGTLYNFAQNYYYDPGVNLAPKLDLRLDTATNTQYPLPPSNSQTAHRYFVVGVLENTADNTLQGENATFSLLWHLESGV